MGLSVQQAKVELVLALMERVLAATVLVQEVTA